VSEVKICTGEQEMPSNLMTLAAIGVLGVGVIAFLASILELRRAQTASYYGVRRAMQQNATRRMTFALICLTLAAVLWVAHFSMPDLTLSTNQPTSTVVAAIQPTSTDLSTTTPKPTPISTSTITPITETQIPQPLSTPTLPSTTRRLTFKAIGSGVDSSGNPIGGNTTFSKTTKAIFVFFEYRDVPPSAVIRHTWFRNGGSVHYGSAQISRNGSGTASVVWQPPNGFQTGLYEVRFVLGGAPQFTANFEVK
jgi:hypothetical protein